MRQLLSHQAGLPGVDGGFTWEELMAHEPLAERLSAQRPFWQPGQAFMYHGLTIGTLADEIVRRVDGRPVAEVLRDDVTSHAPSTCGWARPPSEDHRVVDALPPTAEELTTFLIGEPGRARRRRRPSRRWRCRRAICSTCCDGSTTRTSVALRRPQPACSRAHGAWPRCTRRFATRPTVSRAC